MNRLLVGVALVAAPASAALLLAVGPAGLVGSARSDTKEAAPARCVALNGTEDGEPSSTPLGGMAGMPDMSGSSSDKSTQELRDRLDSTPSGGMLRVESGVYRGALVIDRPVTLVGIGHPILQGDGTGTVLTIRAAGTTVRNLVIEGSGPGPVGNPAGVRVEADHVVVRDLHIRDTFDGIRVERVRDAQVIGNLIEGRETQGPVDRNMDADMEMDEGAGMGEGADMDMDAGATGTGEGDAEAGRGDAISLWNAIRPVVAGNVIVNARDGVYLSYGSGARIDCNSVVGSRYAVHSMYGKSMTIAGNHLATNMSGVVMMYGGPVTLEGNVIRDHHAAATSFGVLLLDVGGMRMTRNVIVGNRVALQIEGPLDDPLPTRVELNTIALNQVGVALYPTANAGLSQNSLVENTVQVLGLGPDGGGGDSRWSRDGVGNYWSDYRGYFRAGHVVGEMSHVEGTNSGRLLADPTQLALASSPALRLLQAVEQHSAGVRPLSVDRFPLADPRSPSLPAETVHAALGTGLLGATSLVVCSLALLVCARRRKLPMKTMRP